MVQRFFYQQGAPGSPEQTKPIQRYCKRIPLHPNVLPCKCTEGVIGELLQEVKKESESILQLVEQGHRFNPNGL